MKTRRKRPVLEDHRRQGKTLIPPLAQMPIQMMDWERSYLPEHLWLGYLMHLHDVSEAAAIFNTACDVIDEYYVPSETGQVFLGYMSDFNGVPEDKRLEVAETLSNDLPAAFGDDFRAALSLHPDCPAVWLAAGGSGALSAEGNLHMMRQLVRNLRDPRAKKTVQGRILGLNRLLKHDKIGFSSRVVDDALAEGITRYPLTDEETTQRVEQFVRLTMNVILSRRNAAEWPRRFWIANFLNLKCR